MRLLQLMMDSLIIPNTVAVYNSTLCDITYRSIANNTDKNSINLLMKIIKE